MSSELWDGSVGIRRVQTGDAAALYEATRESMQELVARMRWCERDFALENSVAWLSFTESAWTKGDSYNFAIVEGRAGRMAGSIWISRVDPKHGMANLGYWVRTSCAGRGIATAAGRLIARFAFDEIGLNRLEIVVAAGNAASQRVAEKLGARFEGLLRQRLRLADGVKDALMFGLLAQDFKRSNG